MAGEAKRVTADGVEVALTHPSQAMPWRVWLRWVSVVPSARGQSQGTCAVVDSLPRTGPFRRQTIHVPLSWRFLFPSVSFPFSLKSTKTFF